ncbi:nuclease [Blastococcus sp. MG754426]|uniref:nuclease-related domain-containing DEAD/DEAH box helicase n=1 Tax=unclassified Blastococcus TaxID=2619396 RepID=UPI001EEF8A41|nr:MULTISPECIES: NERD domain-containing protein [unclassified Blastococcus]MCF6508716.1 nuclease [Blastococcus sp. MG754426]MCF6513325.1 nuclease [Blastococcus sp. MG754427]MCF6734060.1 nuclease [Blastococcus sp. KM273129]
MTARVFPSSPVFESHAERLFAEALRDQLPDDAVMVCGQRFSDRREDREADVIVAWPGFGIAVVEVKGGSVHLRGGEWRQVGGGLDKQIRPVEQALRCKYLLRDYLRRDRRWTAGDPRMVHLVALPATTLPDDFAAPDAPRWMVLDKTDLPQAAARVASALRQCESDVEPPTAEDVEAFVDCLAGVGIPQQDLLATLHEREAECDLLTRDQARVLDWLRSNRRVEVRGGAGSGKTWLALEKARRLTLEGERVAVMCYSRGLAEYLRRRVETWKPKERPAYVGTFHGLGIDWGVTPGSDDDSGYWEEYLPERMVKLAGALSVADRFDAIVIDEAQDFAESWWPAVLAALRTPEGGCLYVFADEGQRVFARQGRPPVALTPFDLDENLRNTKQIAGTFGSLTTSQMRYRGGDGVPVRFVQCDTDDAIGAADDEAAALLDAGWPAESVALLTTYRRHPVQAERQTAGQDAYWDSFWADDDLFYGHVLGFKGLERPAVVLAVNGFRDEERAREMLYVGLSRARDLLVVCGDLELIRRVGGPAVAQRLAQSAGSAPTG